MSKEQGIDEFDNTRIMESAFNRLFLAVEHLANAMILREKGNYSKKHFGDFKKLGEFKEKYGIDIAANYQATYTFRGYADYRKFPEIKEKFDRENLNQQINKVMDLINSCLGLCKEEFPEIANLFKEKTK